MQSLPLGQSIPTSLHLFALSIVGYYRDLQTKPQTAPECVLIFTYHLYLMAWLHFRRHLRKGTFHVL